jgi:hypothetical protein
MTMNRLVDPPGQPTSDRIRDQTWFPSFYLVSYFYRCHNCLPEILRGTVIWRLTPFS